MHQRATVGGQWYIEVLVYGTAPTLYLIQVAYDLAGSGNAWTRTCINGTWAGWVQLNGAGGNVRPLLTANRTYFVDTVNGNDANNGLAAGAGNAFKTFGKAMTVVGAIDTGAFQLTVSGAAGTYNEAITLPKMVGALPAILQGVGSTTIINPTTANAIAIMNDGAGTWIVQNLKMVSNATAGSGLMMAQNGGIIKWAPANLARAARAAIKWPPTMAVPSTSSRPTRSAAAASVT